MPEEIEVTEDDIIEETTEEVTEIVEDIIDEADEVIDVLEDLGLIEEGRYDNLVALVQKNKKYILAAVGLLVVAFYALT
jgi:hypothetical protein